MKKMRISAGVALLLIYTGLVQAGADNVTGVLVNYAPNYLNAASSGNGYIDGSKGPVGNKIAARTGFALRNKGLPPAAGAASDPRAHRIAFTFGKTLYTATNLVLKPSMTGVPAHSGTWRLVINKANGTTASYNCNFTDTTANCFDGTNRAIKLAGIAGAVSGYIEVEGMPNTSEIVIQTLRFTINDNGNGLTTGPNEYDILVSYK